MKTRILLILLTASCIFSAAQDIPIGSWREHVSYRQGIGVEAVGDDIYCLTTTGLFVYSISDGVIERISKIDGLSGSAFTALGYNETQRCIVIGYEDGSIDLIKGGDIINIPDIRISNVLGRKTINNIYCKNNSAYLACPFGIVALDLQKEEVTETYKIGPGGVLLNINDFTADDKNFYAATDSGIFWAPQNNPALGFYESWKQLCTPDSSVCKAIDFWKGKLYYYLTGIGRLIEQVPGENNYKEVFGWDILTESIKVSYGQLIVSAWACIYYFEESSAINNTIRTIFINNKSIDIDPYTACYIGNGEYFVADKILGILHIKSGETIFGEIIQPNSPYSTKSFSLTSAGENIWVAAGGHQTNWAASWISDGMFHFRGGKWTNYNSPLKSLPEGLRDITFIAVDPYDDQRVYAGTWGKGVIEMISGEVTNVYNEDNSPLRPRKVAPDQGVFIAGIAFDSYGTLWMANSTTDNLLVSLDRNGNWESHNLGTPFNDGVDVSNLMIDSYNNKWLVTRANRSLIVYNENSEAKARRIGQGAGTGNIDASVFSVAHDKNGETWVGTNKGIYIIQDVSRILSLSDGGLTAINAYRPKLVSADGHVNYLLNDEVVLNITVNGANEKWCATSRQGAYKLSEDGLTTLLHFTAENSPLLSNVMVDIAVTDKGEVFLAGNQGIVSYRDDVSKGNSENNNVYAFPNPVKPDYEGPIAITGVVDMAHIKITDVTGNLVYSTMAKGGQAIWDAKDFKGKRVKTGVYVVFITNDDGSETHVTKIMVLN